MHTRPERIKPCRDSCLQMTLFFLWDDVDATRIEIEVVRPEFVARDLFLDKDIVRLVVIKALDDIVTISPRVALINIGFVAAAVRIARDV